VGREDEGYKLLSLAKAKAESSGRTYSGFELWVAALKAKAKADGREAVKAELATLRSSARKLGFNLIAEKAANLARVLGL
jgi:hypothetical protein